MESPTEGLECRLTVWHVPHVHGADMSSKIIMRCREKDNEQIARSIVITSKCLRDDQGNLCTQHERKLRQRELPRQAARPSSGG